MFDVEFYVFYLGITTIYGYLTHRYGFRTGVKMIMEVCVLAKFAKDLPSLHEKFTIALDEEEKE